MTSAPSSSSITHPPQAKGVAPWERDPNTLPNPDDPRTKAQAERWRRAAANFDTAQRTAHRRRRHAQRAAARRQRQREESQRKLETNARRMYYLGFFFLPLVWLISLIYFRREHRAPNASPIIKKYYKNSLFMFIVYTAIFVAWFVVFQVYSDTVLRKLNIIFFTGTSPTGF